VILLHLYVWLTTHEARWVARTAALSVGGFIGSALPGIWQ
jgi:hypothetical protein